MKYFALALIGGLVAIIASAIAHAPAGVMSMTKEQRAQAYALKVAADAQARNERNARVLCALRLGIPTNDEWSVRIEGATYVVQRGMCRMHRSVVE